MTLQESRAHFFSEAGFPADGGYNHRVFVIRFGPFPTVYYNPEIRARTSKIHDIHHTLTGYKTDFDGESQISAWEIASGCAHHWIALFLDLYGLSIGLVKCPRLTWQAFLRGRYTKNFYSHEAPHELLSEDVDQLRQELLLNKKEFTANFKDRLSFVYWSCVATFLHLVTLPVYMVVPFHLIIYPLFYHKDGRLRDYAFLKRAN